MFQRGILVATLFVFALGGEFDPPSPETTPAESPATEGPTGPPNNTGLILPSNPGDPTQPPLKMMDFCFFGRFPSATCRFKCHLQRLEAYCNEEQSKCLCTEPEEPTEEAEDSEELFDTPAHYPGLFEHPESEDAATQTPEEPSSAQQSGQPHLSISVHPAPASGEHAEPEKAENKPHVVFYVFDLNKVFSHPVNQPVSPTSETTDDVETNTSTPEGQRGDVAEVSEGVAPAGWAFQHIVALLIVVLLCVLILLELYACYKKQTAKNANMETIFKSMPLPNKA